MSRAAIEELTETFRQLVIAARVTTTVESAADACLVRLNALYAENPARFAATEILWLNVLRATLGLRLSALRGSGPHARITRPPGVKLDYCWRCETPLDERFSDFCLTCATTYCRWFICPICRACGCARSGQTLV
jgi:hypothetical protein